MRFMLLAALTALSAFGADAALEKAERGWAEAITKGDIAALEKLLAPELTYTHSNGKRDTKAAYIESIKSGTLKYVSVHYDELLSSVVDGAGLTVLRLKVKSVNAGVQNDMNLSVLHVFVKRNGQWQMVAHQSARLQ